MVKIYKLHEIDLNKLKISDMENNIIIPEYETNNLYFETPELHCIDIIKESRTKYSTHELLVTLNGKDNNSTLVCVNFFNNLDKKIITDCKKNIGILSSNKTNKIMYKSIIQHIDDDNDEYDNGVLRIKFNKRTLVFDSDNKLVTQDQYNKIFDGDTYVKMIFELASLWLIDNIFGVYLKLHQIKVRVNEDIPIYLRSESSEDNKSSEMYETSSSDSINPYDNQLDNGNSTSNSESEIEYVLSD